MFFFPFFLGVSKEKSIAYETQKNHEKLREQVSIRKYMNTVQEKAFINVKDDYFSILCLSLSNNVIVFQKQCAACFP